MENQKSQSSLQIQVGNIPEKWKEKFLIKRIDEDPVEISLAQRDAILAALERGERFIQVRKHTIMLNAIKGIDPLWGEENIPPRPEVQVEYTLEDGVGKKYFLNQKELDEWDNLFARKEVKKLV